MSIHFVLIQGRKGAWEGAECQVRLFIFLEDFLGV